jgi:ribosomal protein S18 acetylase RimI-like enzyme
VIVREATDADWPQVWPIVRAVVRAGETYTYDQDLTEDTARALWMQLPPGRTYVAVEGATVLGTAKTHPNQGGPGAHVANASFMVDAAHGGKGVGRALAEHAIAEASQHYRAMQFNAVVETNTHAVRLWQSLGFEILTTVPEAFHHPVHGYVGLHVMHRRLV